MKRVRTIFTLAVALAALFALGCAATEEKKDESTGGTVTVSGNILYGGTITAADFLIGVFTQAAWDLDQSDPLILTSVPAAASAPYSVTVDADLGGIVVASFYDLNSNTNPDSGEYGGYMSATVGSSSLTGVDVTLTADGLSGGGNGGGATELTVNATATAGSVFNGSGADYYFAGGNGTTYTVTLTSAELTTGTPGNADLDVCSTSSCGWGDGAGPNGGQSHSSGTATETVTFTASASQSYYINVWGVSDTAYTIRVTSGGGGGGLTFTNGDGIAEMTAVPVWPTGVTGTATSSFNVNVPVDADTYEVNVILGSGPSSSFTIMGGGVLSVGSGSAQTAVVPVTLISTLTAGDYYAWVVLCPAAGSCDVTGTGTWYMQSTSVAGTYVKVPLTSGTPGNFVETGVGLSYLTFP